LTAKKEKCPAVFLRKILVWMNNYSDVILSKE